jgi:protein subunit release factor B
MNGGMNSNREGELNVDDLVKKIDAKIAELEEEERKEKEEEEKKKQAAVQQPAAPVTTVSAPKTEPSNVVNINDLSKDNNTRMYTDDTDDENFFDDFFSDGE